MTYSHIVTDENLISDECQFCRMQEIPNFDGRWVGCDRCFAWYHVPCVGDYDAPPSQPQRTQTSRGARGRARASQAAGSNQDNDTSLWFCEPCRLQRQREGDIDYKAIVVPVLKLINDLQIDFVDSNHVLAKALLKAGTTRAAPRDAEYKKIWRLGGEQRSAVNLLLAANLKCKVALNRKKLMFLDFDRFASLEVGKVEQAANSKFDDYLKRELGALICRGLRVENLGYVFEEDPSKAPATAAEEEARISRRERLRTFFREQAEKFGGEEWDTHSLWDRIRLQLQAVILCGKNSALLPAARSALSGRPGSIDLRKKLEDFMPEAFIALAGSQTSVAERELSVGSCLYVARSCIRNPAEDNGDTYSSILAETVSVSGCEAIFYYRTEESGVVCDICVDKKSSSEFEEKFCTCTGTVCYACEFRHSAILLAADRVPECPFCRSALGGTGQGITKLLSDTRTFLQLLVSLNPKSRQALESLGEDGVAVPDNSAGIDRGAAFGLLKSMYAGGNSSQNDDMTHREVAAMYREQLNLPLDMPDDEVMERARVAALPEGAPVRARPSQEIPFAQSQPALDADLVNRLWTDDVDDDDMVLLDDDLSPLRSGPVSMSDGDASPRDQNLTGLDDEVESGATNMANEPLGGVMSPAANGSPTVTQLRAGVEADPQLAANLRMDLPHPGLTTVTASGVPSRLGSLDTGGTTSMENGQGTAEVGVVSDILSNSGVSSNASALLGLTTLSSRSQGLRVLSRSAPAATATGSSGSDLLMSFGNNLTRGSTQSNGHGAATVNANASQTGGSFDVRRGATTRDLPLTAPARGIIRADSPYHRTVAGGASGTQQALSGGHQNVEPVNEGPLHEGDSTENGDERPPNPSPNLNGTNPYGATIPGMLFTLTNRNNEAFWWEHRLYAREGRGTRVGLLTGVIGFVALLRTFPVAYPIPIDKRCLSLPVDFKLLLSTMRILP
ncbi:hypothetical protein FOZ63_022520 [Perkinsus olseni]|uniref:RING-type domain-containing protein n=1 Tax=Perkinsus olseni TaxID=32597 RepID=A0A7J6RN19_PEROL|nr:hypothetical protein FOZ63_022520 [Perkinsus olseni]